MPDAFYTLGPAPQTVRTAAGQTLAVPAMWRLLPPGDVALTRRVKAAGEHWILKEHKGRKLFSRGLYAPAATIDRIQSELVAERATETFAKRKATAARSRAVQQESYVEDFRGAVVAYLAFAARHAEAAETLAAAVTAHATPVGSGTVARTKRIPIERRAESAVIAWLRHQTTGYDGMTIARVKGKRREVRRMLAQRSKSLLERYRQGETPSSECPLRLALERLPRE